MPLTKKTLLAAIRKVSKKFCYVIFLTSSVVYSAEQANTAQSTVLHTEYVATHSHGELRVVKVKSPSSKPFASLFQLYEFEFVPYTHKEVDTNGHYEQDLWSDAGADIYVLYCGDTPIGFAVVNCASMLDGNKEVHDFAEFFIMPSHRRRGCGLWLAHTMFNKYPGHWEIREVPNHPAIRNFWRETIRAYVGTKFTDTDMDSAAWVGPLQTFNTKDRIDSAGVRPQREQQNGEVVNVQGGNQYSYVLKASPGKGVGVFALHDIPAGAPISDRFKFKIRKSERSEIPQALLGHCAHLANNVEIAPDRFDHMPIFWYMNHSEESCNVKMPHGISIIDDQWLIMEMYALENIKAGDELLCNYNELGEPEESKEDFYRKQ